MKRPNPGEAAWGVIAAYELLCPPKQTLCEALDPWIVRHPVAMRVLIAYTALHVANCLPKELDGYYQAAVAASHARKRLTRRISARR